MEKLWITNIAPGATDEELKALVAKYSLDPIECTEVERVEGDGSRPAAIMTCKSTKFDTVGKLALRLNGMYWKGRTLSSSTSIG